MLHSTPQNYNECLFCGQEKGSSLALMMSEALMSKHAINQSEGLIGYIDVIMKLQQPCNASEAWAATQYREYQAIDEHDEFLKRQYTGQEYGGKIGMLTEYYKFHSDIPRVVELGIEKILGKYYDKKREYDYKKIKRLLKDQQGLSITSVQDSQSQIGDSMVQKRSRYSTLLDVMEDSKAYQDNLMSDSKLLKDMCRVIEKALPSSKNDTNFQIKGSFNSINHDRIFEEYLKQEERRLKPKLRQRQKEKQRQRQKGDNKFPRRFNLQQLLKKREKRQKQVDKQKQSNFRDSRQTKKKEKEKDNKFIYNTNIKIQIKNAMFYSQGQQPPLHIGNIEYENGNKVDSRFRKKNLINQVNYLNQQSNKKLIADIYKSSQQDLKRRMQNTPNRQRMTTKESMNRSQSKEKKRSLSKQTLQARQLKRNSVGSTSARRIIYNNGNEWALTNNKLPTKSMSTSSLKKRSYSANGIASATASVSSLSKKNDKIFQKRPVETISKYGSSDIKTFNTDAQIEREKRTISIKEILNRKLTFKKQ